MAAKLIVQLLTSKVQLLFCLPHLYYSYIESGLSRAWAMAIFTFGTRVQGIIVRRTSVKKTRRDIKTYYSSVEVRVHQICKSTADVLVAMMYLILVF